MSLATLLEDPTELKWRCGHEEATGVEVLRIARPGLALEPDHDMVPPAVFHSWIYANAERLLRAHVGVSELEEHTADLLGHGLALLAEPIEVTAEMRAVVLMSLASLNMGSVIGGSPLMGGVFEWTRRAVHWSAKRVLAERRCPDDPVSLNEALVQMHVELAAVTGGDADEARSTERAAQIEQLVGCWRAAL